jgi:predicted AAA+ superfamily ATPase
MQIITKSKSLLQQPIKPRPWYYQQLENYLATNQIILVQGQRRVGKSYVIMWYLQQLHLDHDSIFFLNKELDEENEVPDSSALTKLYEEYCKQFWTPTYIVIDEIQDIKEWERFIRARFTEKKSKIIISWSNSQLLSGELATYLAGRSLSFQVFPLDYT